MKTSQYFPLVVSSLAAGGVILVGTPAQSVILQFTTFNVSSFPLIGIKYELSGLDGRPLNIISTTSPEFPITQLSGNNTTSPISVTLVGTVVEPGDPYTFLVNVEDNPNGTSGFRFLNPASIIATPTGTQEEPFPTVTIAASTSAGANTPFSVYKFPSSTVFNGQPFDFTSIIQAPGDQITFSDIVISGTSEFSSQAIPGYVPFDQLNNFGPSSEITFTPGITATVTNAQQLPSTPEPSIVASLSALSFGAFLKRKLLKNRTKAS